MEPRYQAIQATGRAGKTVLSFWFFVFCLLLDAFPHDGLWLGRWALPWSMGFAMIDGRCHDRWALPIAVLCRPCFRWALPIAVLCRPCGARSLMAYALIPYNDNVKRKTYNVQRGNMMGF